MSRYLSGRSRKRPQSQLSDDRDRYFSVDQAEPNLGDPSLTDVEANIPAGNQYQIVSVIGSPGKRYWIPRGGGLIPGSITVYDENTIVPNNSSISSISQLIFKGDAIKAEGYLNPDGSPGIGVTITVFAPGSQGQFIINNSNEFTGVSSIFYDVSNNRIGVGTNVPTQIFDVNGDIRLRRTIYDWNNNPGSLGNLLVKNSDGGISWTNSTSVITAAGGTIGQIQFHSNTGLVDGADLFYYDYLNNRVGIGSTQPKYLLDVSGISSFKGTTYVDDLNVTNLGTFNNLSVTGFSTFAQLIDANGGATINNVRIGVAGSNEIDTSTGNLILNSNGGTVQVNDDLTVSGITSVGFITAKNAYVSGILTGANLNFVDTSLTNLRVTGIATINAGIVTNLNVTGVATNNNLNVTTYLDVLGNANFQKESTFNNLKVTGISTFGNLKISVNTLSSSTGNLVLDSAGATNSVQSNDKFFVNEATESTSTSTGSFRTLGGIGVVKSANIGGDLRVTGEVTLASNGGITTTIGDLYVGGDLYTKDSLFLDNINANTGEYLVSLKTKDFTATGLSSISSLNVTGFSTFAQLIDANGGATIDNIRIGVAGDNEIDTSTGNLILNSNGGTVSVNDNLTVSGTSTFNGDVIVGNEATDNITFNSRVNSNILPSGTRDIGSSTILWDNIYANNFVGKVVGNAESATKLINARNFSISGDVDASVVLFDGTDDVELVTTLDTTGVAADTYGSLDGASYPRFVVDAKGRITSASNVGIAFSTATVAQSDSIKTASSTSINDHFLTFVDSNNTTPGSTYESLYTNVGIFYKPSTNLLSLGNLTVSGISTFNGNVTLGNDPTDDTVTFISRVNSNILPSGTRDIGSTSIKWDNVYANNIVGEVTGNAESATKLKNARNFSLSGDVDATAILFDGTGDVNLVTTLDTTGVAAATYGSSTSIPVLSIDAKGRITSASNVGVAFSTATVAQADSIKTASSTSINDHFLTFVADNNTTPGSTYESLYTNVGIFYNPSTNLLSVTNLTVSGTSTFNGDVTVGNEATDNITFNSRVNSNIIPAGISGTKDLGSTASLWNNVYANNFVGRVVGVADSAAKLQTPRNFSISGDVDATAILFDGTGDVNLVATLDTTGVTSTTYGSSTSIPVLSIDAKGRITSATTAGVVGSPVGTVINYAGTSPPTDYLVCNGAPVSRTVYAQLFAVILTTYGSGDGVNTFNLPDLQNRFVTGVGPSYAIGATGGFDRVQLQVSELPSHNHPGSSGGLNPEGSHSHPAPVTVSENGAHTHGYVRTESNNAPKGGDNVAVNRGTFSSNTEPNGAHSHTVTVSIQPNGSHSHTFSSLTVGSQGGGDSHENRPPYIALLPCIKYQ